MERFSVSGGALPSVKPTTQASAVPSVPRQSRPVALHAPVSIQALLQPQVAPVVGLLALLLLLEAALPAEADKAKQQRLLGERVGGWMDGAVMSPTACSPDVADRHTTLRQHRCPPAICPHLMAAAAPCAGAPAGLARDERRTP